MTISEFMELAREGKWRDEDDNVIAPKFLPGLSETAIQALENKIGARYPVDYRVMLGICSGIDDFYPEIDFVAESDIPWGGELMPRGVPFAHDGFGNHWYVDVLAHQEEEAMIYFLNHDPTGFLFQGKGMSLFFDELVKLTVDESSSLLDKVHEDRLFDVFRNYPGEMTHAQALAGDPLLSAFAQTLEPKFLFVDLRNAPIGMGLDPGRFGVHTEERRFGDHRIFAYAPPDKKPAKGLLSRLFGR